MNEPVPHPDLSPEANANPALPATSDLPPALTKYVSNFQQLALRYADRCDRLANYIAPRNQEDELAPENVARTPIIFGMVMIALLFVVFGLWSVLAPIDSAAIAQGKIVLDSSVKTIEHLEGGIVQEIMVKEGMVVEEGQALVRLDDTAARARLDLYKGQYISAKATEARLIAERDMSDEIAFPDELLSDRDEPAMAANLDSQRRLFETRRESVLGQTDVLQQQIKQSEEEIKGLRDQVRSYNKQLELLASEIKDVRHLLKTGDATRTRLLSLERASADLEGRKGERVSLIARAEQMINQSKIEMYNLKTEFLNKVIAELKETQTQLSNLQEQMKASEDVVNRIIIYAPIGGEITGLKVHTVGGVIAPNETIMEIVPSDDQLIVEAKVSPQDIDVVRPGLMARVRLSAFKARNVPPLEGVVTVVSADRIEDPRTGQSYFTARITIDDAEFDDLDNVELSPGMPAEVLIVTGSRSFMSYLMSPISESFNRAFREQ